MSNELNIKGRFFSEKTMKKVRDSFLGLDYDPVTRKKRIYFDNAGGSFRLKTAAEVFSTLDNMPDCSERMHAAAQYMNDIMKKAEEDVRVIFNAQDGGRIITRLTASQTIWELTGVIAENVSGTNIVTTKLEHPCAFDAARFFSEKTGKELRVADTNPVTGGVDAEAITKLIDKDTSLLSVILASNISGVVINIEQIVKEARRINPDLHIIVDSVQHAPHGIIDVDLLKLDGAVFAPYKFFGVRGSGIGYVSERVCKLPHKHLINGSEEADLTWKLGSPAPAHFAVITAIVDYVCGLGAETCESAGRRALFTEGMKNIGLQERALMYHMLEGDNNIPGLRHIPGVKIFLDSADMISKDFILAISLENWDHEEAVREYERRGIIVYERISSSIYSSRMLRSLGINGCIRVSPLHCNTVEEINEFLTVTGEMVAARR